MTTGLQLLGSRDCKLYLPFREGAGTTAYDQSGQGNNGTITGASYKKLVDGGYALDFDASDYITIGGSATSLNDLSDTYTVCFWFKAPPTLQTTTMFSGAGTSIYRYPDFFTLADGGLLHRGSNSAAGSNAPAGTIVGDTWYFITGTGVGTTTKLYVNGTFISTYTQGSVNNLFYHTIVMGKRGDSTYPYTGQIAYPMIFSRALSLPEIQAIYRATYIL